MNKHFLSHLRTAAQGESRDDAYKSVIRTRRHETWLCDVLLLTLFGELTTKSQINHTLRLILSYERLILAWLVSYLLFLNHPDYLLPLGVYLSLFL